MTHPELLFILHQALHIQKLSQKYKKEGEEFHPSNVFTDLSNGLSCQARISEDNLPVLRVKLKGKSKNTMLKSVQTFFGGEFIEIPSKIDGEYVFSAKKLPKSTEVFK